MGTLNLITKSLYSARCHLISDPVTKSSLQVLFENVLGKTRQLLRVFSRGKEDILSNNFRSQHRLPVDYFSKGTEPTVPRKSKFLSYRPGFIHEITSKWASESLAGTVGKQGVKKIFRGAKGPMLCFVGFGLAKKPSLLTNEEELESVSFEIREAFSSIQLQNYEKEMPILEAFNGRQFKFSDLKIGEMIAKGCNAAVYSASLVEQKCLETAEFADENSVWIPETQFAPSKLFISHSEGELNYDSNVSKEPVSTYTPRQPRNIEEFNLAVKVMFNYSAESNAYAIWRAMYKETLPTIADFSLGEMTGHKVRKKKLKPHPNIVEMYFAFADQLPLLPGAFTNYPQALPVRLLSDGCGRNMTLFLVMKKYDCSLKDYLKTHDVSAHTALLLFTQLLEALVHLLQNEVAHRDLKTDNILLDLSYGTSSPKLAITDFGCSLEDLQLNYSSPEIEKGGNMALMAPEVVSAEPRSFSVIDYSRADLWTVGTLAYEIFGGANPFYSPNSNLKNIKYDENNLPFLPSKAPTALQRLVRDILHVNPGQRPTQSFAATVCQILLHGAPDLSECKSPKDLCRSVLEWMCLMSAETYVESSSQNAEEKNVEVELRHTFCTRIQYLEVLEAVKYITQE
jgi:PTEN induced putative kinase 1